jgi:hypothetical protein
LLLEDDPAFLPDAELMPLLEDVLQLNVPPAFDESQLSAPLSFGGTPAPLGNLVLPSSQSASVGGFVLPGGDSVGGGPRASSLFAREENEPLLDLDVDIGISFDADGNLHEEPASGFGPYQTPALPFTSGNGNATARVRGEHVTSQAGFMVR